MCTVNLERSNGAVTSASWQTTHSECSPRAVTSRGTTVDTALTSASVSVTGGADAAFATLACFDIVGFFT